MDAPDFFSYLYAEGAPFLLALVQPPGGYDPLIERLAQIMTERSGEPAPAILRLEPGNPANHRDLAHDDAGLSVTISVDGQEVVLVALWSQVRAIVGPHWSVTFTGVAIPEEEPAPSKRPALSVVK